MYNAWLFDESFITNAMTGETDFVAGLGSFTPLGRQYYFGNVDAVQNPSNAPFNMDGCWAGALFNEAGANNGSAIDPLDPIASLGGLGGGNNHLGIWLERHPGSSVNASFIDGSSRGLQRGRDQWDLEWHRDYQPEGSWVIPTDF